MEHTFDPNFENYRGKLPPDVRRRVPRKFELLQQNPTHRSLRFKKVRSLWSVRISKGYRALAREEADAYVWYWIGTHDEYEKRIRTDG
ncbi:hypothetical protein C6496_15775 [Candidatus Poribacteria bacterium]|nr:MAG: hypothetical protein C6496_15775 [Candidatus Poribacteria bacterium]